MKASCARDSGSSQRQRPSTLDKHDSCKTDHGAAASAGVAGAWVNFRQPGLDSKPEQQLLLADGSALHYGHLFNCAGLQADRVAHSWGGASIQIAIKGLYWQLKESFLIKPSCNLYPVRT